METIIQQRQDIINHLNLVPEKKLNEVDLFIQFILFQTHQNTKQIIKQEEKQGSKDDFFDICGMWQDKDIDINSLRKKAWRKLEW